LREKRQERKSEFEVPPHTHVRLTVTIAEKVMARLKAIHKQELKRAEDEDRTELDWSNTVEMIMRKGTKAYSSSQKTLNRVPLTSHETS